MIDIRNRGFADAGQGGSPRPAGVLRLLLVGLTTVLLLVGSGVVLGADGPTAAAGETCRPADGAAQEPERCQCSSPDCDHDNCKCKTRGDDAPEDRAAADERPRLSTEVATMVDVLGAEPGSVIADIGAGNGRFSVQLAGVVGPEGRVYANEVSDGAVGRIRARVEDSGAGNVTVVKGSVADTSLPDECCDALMLRMVYHHLTDPEAMNWSFWRALRPGGRLVIIDNHPRRGRNAPGVPENRSGMGMDRQIIIDEVTRAGFELERSIEDWPGGPDHALVFRKPAS